MRKNAISYLLLIASVFITLSTVRAQYVSIPDSAFAQLLLFNNYTACVSGNGTTGYRLDTTCYRVVTATNLDISSYSGYTPIHDLTGLRYFKNLRTLYGSNYSSITNLPALPDSITYIDFQGIGLSTLPPLPDSLQFLNVGFAQLTSLPALPAALTTLYCNNNHLTSIPALPPKLRILLCYLNSLPSLPTLPDSLTSLDCESNSLTALPALPAHLASLNCTYNSLSALPALPDSLHSFNCSYNHIAAMPALPAGLTGLSCAHNNLSSLPAFPAGITSIYCDHNSLSSLPALPTALTVLSCDSNQLDSLPAFPAGFTELHCNANHLSTLPLFPAGINIIYCRYNPLLACLPPVSSSHILDFYINGTAINCIPNSFSAYSYDFDPTNMPLCVGRCYSTNFNVAIPDSNLGHFLYTHGFAACMSGNGVTGYQLDTSSALVRTADTINCSHLPISNMQGIQCFHHLRYLDCSYDTLAYSTTLTWPTDLTYLDCSYTTLTDLHTLPAGLVYLDCAHNGGVYSGGLPNTLPSTLRYLDCSYNLLPNLPTHLPTGLTYLNCSVNSFSFGLPAMPSSLLHLDCSYGSINALPSLPAGLTYLDCHLNGLNYLDSLPAALQYFDCSDNRIDSIPPLPSGLTYLHCSGNLGGGPYTPLNKLPSLPATLSTLNCSNNQITNLPALPTGLTQLICDSNRLTTLPSIPSSITTLKCSNNAQLSCLPPVYSAGLDSFYIGNTAISCLPNVISATHYDINPLYMSLCSSSSGCPVSAYQIRGSVHNDTSATCIADSLAPGTAMQNVKVLLELNGQVVAQSYSDSSGAYAFNVSPSYPYTVTVDTSYLPFTVACPASNTYLRILSPADSIATGLNFGLRCYGEDYGITLLSGPLFKPGDTTIAYVIAGNPLLHFFNAGCGVAMSGTVMTMLDGPAHYAGPAPGALTPSSVLGDTLLYTVSDLDSLTLGSLYIRVYTDTSAVIGTPVCMSGVITPASPDAYPVDDTLSSCFAVVSSFDPNHKMVTPESISASGDWLTYTVEFQNTGTASASTVVVRDTLSTLVLPETFRYIASSHAATVQVAGRAVTFTFPHIGLVDSAVDQQGSRGWLQYKVRSKPNLPSQSQVKNTAFIYFDYNAAIVTNTIVSTVKAPLSISSVEGNKAGIYPNPNKGYFTLLTSGSAAQLYTISDMLGHIVAQQPVTADSQQVDLRDMAAGVYTLRVGEAQPLRFVIVK